MAFKLKMVVLALGLSTAAWASAQDAVKVRIGQAGPLSGPAAHLGLDNANGARFAAEELNAKGTKIGGKAVRFEIIAEDDAADPRQATLAAQKFCDQNVNGVVGHLTSGASIPAARIYNNCGLPHISPTASNPKLTDQGYKTTFRLIANDNSLGAELARYISSTMKLKKVVIIDDRTAYGQGLTSIFKKTAQELGLQIVAEEYTSDKAVDFAPILSSIKAKQPDVIFYGGLDAQAGLMLRQMNSLGMAKVPVLGGDGICTDKLAELAGIPNVNAICAVGGAAVERTAAGRDWRARYDARFPGSFQANGHTGYDATMALVEAMRLANSTDPKVYAPFMFKVDFVGVTGRVAFDAHGDMRYPAITIKKFQNGKAVATE